jgi:hypothetical protein
MKDLCQQCLYTEGGADMRITIHAVPVEGGRPSTMIIEQTGPDTGTINLDGTNYDVYDVKASPDGKRLVCKTDYSIIIVTVTLTVTLDVLTSDVGGATVRISIVGGPIKRTGDYRITPADETELIQFVTGAKFPALA